jgi:murein DD-endopeptidase MepM/ murein hydrolase activator NlpD
MGPVAVIALAAVQLSLQARAVEPGELVVLEIVLPEHRDAVRVRAFNRDAAAFAVGDRQWRALVGIDLDVKPGPYVVTVDAGGGLTAKTDVVVGRHVFPTRRLTVDEGFVNPPPQLSDRIAQEAALLRTTWHHVTSQRFWSAPFVRPVPQPANSRFGTRSIFNGRPRGAHGGADFLSPAGTSIRAPNAGRIVVARDLYFTGNTVVIDHGLGIFSMLAHLSAIDVGEGDSVEAADVIGLVGATGRVTGPHLHWAVRVNLARVDPLSVLALLGSETVRPLTRPAGQTRTRTPRAG